MPLHPGPYIAERLDGMWIVRTEDHVVLAELPDRGPGIDQEAHAKVMAASNGLLESLEGLVNAVFETEAIWGKAINIRIHARAIDARAAIARATTQGE